MAIDKRITGDMDPNDPRLEQVTINIANEEMGEATMLDDGSAIIGDVQETTEQEFDSNLAEFVSEDVLTNIANDLLDKYDRDKASRDQWEQGYRKGLDLLGFQYTQRS